MNLSELKNQIISRAKGLGANACNIADLTDAAGYIKRTYGDNMLVYSRAVSVAVYFPKDVVQQQMIAPTRSYEYLYSVINSKLDDISLVLANMIQASGYRAYPIPASSYREKHKVHDLQHRLNDCDIDHSSCSETELAGDFGHRLAASLSGIGWVGKSCNIINPDVGPRLRLVTVLTDAPFDADAPLENKCGDCTKCREICPAGAIAGNHIKEGDPLELYFDADACNGHLGRMGKVFGEDVCALCLAVCPWGDVSSDRADQSNQK